MEKSLKDLIARLPIPGLKESTNRRIIAEVLTKELGVSIKPSQIALKDEILTVAMPPVVKSALQVKQKNILHLLQKEEIKVSAIR